MSCCQEARQMLQDAGLKISLGRLKIIEILLNFAARQERISCRALHDVLVDSGSPLSLISVRQVLKRLVQSGLVVNDEADLYRLAPPPRDEARSARRSRKDAFAERGGPVYAG